ncbi:hypothetical protein GWK47_043851 [Chionoecetes opilio]|uniref:Uncharacterized protein n=1 Tax=Chionoecetes opilio TaxID=41210 RepID=A0A8J4YH83_CHIOP|nr:hypothetical protein GWK47_043851 [Chionoecetes opilio]
MDKFIVDETTVQKAHNTNTSARTQQQPTTNDTGFKKSAVEERNRQQHQIMVGGGGGGGEVAVTVMRGVMVVVSEGDGCCDGGDGGSEVMRVVVVVVKEQFLRSREQSLTLLKSPWQATMETGTPDAAFDDKRQRIKLANTVCDRADTMLADQSWLEPPKPMPLVTPSMPAEVTATPAVQPSGRSPPFFLHTLEDLHHTPPHQHSCREPLEPPLCQAMRT